MADDDSTLRSGLETALKYLQANQPAPAEAILRTLLANHSNQPDVLHYLGVAVLQQGRLQEAYDSIQRSLQISQNFAAFNNLGHVLRLGGRADDALACFNRAVELAPDHADAYWNSAALLIAARRHDLAIAPLQKLVALQPTHPQAHKLLAMSLAEMSYFERAASEFEAHVKLEPNDAEAFGRKATALAQLKRFEQAIAAATTAVELAPDRAEAHNNLAWVLERAGKPAAAEASYRRAIELDPKFVMAIGNLAAMCERTDRVDEALSLFERTAEIDPQHLEAQNAVAGCYNKLGDYRAALAAAERALTIKPHDPAARGHRSLTLLAFGRYEEGFAEYEWRWQCKDFTTPEREFTQPRYRGGDVAGRTILVYSEQGYGDNIQFARYLPLLAERGAKVIFECPASLRRLMECVPNASKIIVGGLRPPPFDLQAPLLSLPHAFKTSLETVPNAVPYFKLPANLVESWRQKVESQRRQLNVGLLWRGNTKPNPRRSIPFADLAPLAHQDIAFFSLQVGEQAREAAAAPAGMQLVDFSNEVADFYDLAGLMSNLDMIVTIDSAPAHLAGALGLPTWTLLIKAADWRWLQDRDDSPWYPTMKLIRQHRSDDWSGVVSEVAAALHAKVR